jgi:hypothetical protein
LKKKKTRTHTLHQYRPIYTIGRSNRMTAQETLTKNNDEMLNDCSDYLSGGIVLTVVLN